MKRVDYYKTYYENLSPSNFKVEKDNDKIVISGIENHYPKGFDDKDVKQYKVKQSKIDKYEKGGGIGQYAPLYHYVKMDMIQNILVEDKVKGSLVKGDKEYGISTTRNPYSRMGTHNYNDDRLVLDQNKLRRDGYKIVPFDYLSIAIGREDETNINHYATKIDPSRDTIQGFGFEYEEVILGNIEPLEDYLLHIDLSLGSVERIVKNLDRWEEIMEYLPNVNLRLYEWGKRPYEVSIEDLRKLEKEYKEKNPQIYGKRRKKSFQNGGQVPMNVKRFDKEGKEIDRMTWYEALTDYKRGGRIKPNKIVSSLQNTIDEVKNKIIDDADITQEQKKKLREIRAYVVDSSRGMAWYKKGYFSVPLWCYEKQEMSSVDFQKKYHDWDKNWFDSHRGRKGYFIYYVAHELAHFLCYVTNLLDCKGHKVGFYDAFLKLCPKEYQFYELNYIKKSDKYGVPTYEQCKLTPIEEQTPSTEFCLDGNFKKALDLWQNSMAKIQLT